MIQEFSIVRLKRPLPDADIPVGTTGAVVMLHGGSPPAYEVEFFDASGETLRDTRSGFFTFTTDDEHIEIVNE